MNTEQDKVLRDPFVVLMICGKAEFSEPDVQRLLTDMDYTVSERDKRLKQLNTEETAESIGNADGWKFLMLMADENWRKQNPLQGDIVELPYQLGALVTSDIHLKGILGNGEELAEFQKTLQAASAIFQGYRNEGII